MNKDHIVRSFGDFHNAVQKFGDSALGGFLFRGVKSVSYTLVPKVGRLQTFRGRPLSKKDEWQVLDNFKREAVPFLQQLPSTDWEWLAVGQHHGLPTRLLDWTTNPLVACWFAVEEFFDGDSVVYAYRGAPWVNLADNPNPLAIGKIWRYAPPHLSRRITTQSGLFTAHPNPHEPLTSDGLFRIVIPQPSRRPIKKDLCKYGIHAGSIYPDLSGIAKHIEWRKTDAY
jgi:FRG domain